MSTYIPSVERTRGGWEGPLMCFHQGRVFSPLLSLDCLHTRATFFLVCFLCSLFFRFFLLFCFYACTAPPHRGATHPMRSKEFCRQSGATSNSCDILPNPHHCHTHRSAVTWPVCRSFSLNSGRASPGVCLIFVVAFHNHGDIVAQILEIQVFSRILVTTPSLLQHHCLLVYEAATLSLAALRRDPHQKQCCQQKK